MECIPLHARQWQQPHAPNCELSTPAVNTLPTLPCRAVHMCSGRSKPPTWGKLTSLPSSVIRGIFLPSLVQRGPCQERKLLLSTPVVRLPHLSPSTFASAPRPAHQPSPGLGRVRTPQPPPLRAVAFHNIPILSHTGSTLSAHPKPWRGHGSRGRGECLSMSGHRWRGSTCRQR